MRLSSYWIYKKQDLPLGIDLFLDLQNRFEDEEIRVIFDVGANIGQSLERFKRARPQASIYSFEPVSLTFQELKKRTQQHSNTYLENIGLGSQKGNFPIYLEKKSAWNSLIPKTGKSVSSSQEMVQIDRLDEYRLAHHIPKIDLLKIDTEGYDLEVLKGALQTLEAKEISFIYCEVGFDAHEKRHTYFPDLLSFLKTYGYYFYALYDIRDEGSAKCYANALFSHKQGKVIANNVSFPPSLR